MLLWLLQSFNQFIVVKSEVNIRYYRFNFVAINFKNFKGLYGAQFATNRAAFSAVTLFQTVGFITGFASSVYLCTYQKVYIYLGITFLSLITYSGLTIKNSFIEQKEKKLKNIPIE